MTSALAHAAYLLLALALTTATATKCVPKGVDVRYEVVRAKCPCYVQYRASSTSTKITKHMASFLVLPQDNYTAWETANFKPSLPLVQETIQDVSERTYSVSYTRIPEKKVLNQTGNYVLVILTTFARKDCNAKFEYVFKTIPPACPPRLAAVTTSTTARIISGTPVSSKSEAHNDVFLKGSNFRKCSGSLIAPDWVLTAAHCNITAGLAYVGSKPDDHTRTEMPYQITRAVPHPDFFRTRGTRTPIHDIALVQLSTPVPNSQPLLLNDNPKSPSPNSIVRASGFGDLAQGYTSDRLNFVDLPILGLDACRNGFRYARKAALADAINDDAHICIGSDDECNGGICDTDSGGPLVTVTEDGRLAQVGVASYGDDSCDTRDSPDVFARVGSYAKWIAETTGGKAQFVTVNGNDNGSRATNRNAANANTNTRSGTGTGGSSDQTGRSVSGNAQISGGLSPVAKSALVALAVAVVVLVTAACIAIPWRKRRAKERAMTTPIDSPLEPPPPPPAWDSAEPTDVDPSLTGFVVVPKNAGKRESLGLSMSGFTVVPAKYRWR